MPRDFTVSAQASAQPEEQKNKPLSQNEQNLKELLGKLQTVQPTSSGTVSSENKVTAPAESELKVGQEVTLHGIITNLMLDEVHVKLAQNHRTYIMPRELFVKSLKKGSTV